jgi:hypothetical protein
MQEAGMDIKGLTSKPGIATRSNCGDLRICSREHRRFSKRSIAKARRRKARVEIEYGLIQEEPSLQEAIGAYGDEGTPRFRNARNMVMRSNLLFRRYRPCYYYESQDYEDYEYDEPEWEESTLRELSALYAEEEELVGGIPRWRHELNELHRFEEDEHYRLNYGEHDYGTWRNSKGFDDGFFHADDDWGDDDYWSSFIDESVRSYHERDLKEDKNAAEQRFLSGLIDPPKDPPHEQELYEEEPVESAAQLAPDNDPKVVDLKDLWKRNGLA